jgi:hypothetical protein
MEYGIDNMLTLAEDLLVAVVMDKSKSKRLITVHEIPSEDRDPKCPIRLRVDPSQEVLGQLPARQPPPPVKNDGRQLSGKLVLRQQDRAWREKKKRES